MKEDRLLKIDDCLKIIPIAKSTWWQGVKAGLLPKPVKIGTSTFWRHSDLMDFIASGRSPSEPQGKLTATA
jgi:prophage regulatory protein